MSGHAHAQTGRLAVSAAGLLVVIVLSLMLGAAAGFYLGRLPAVPLAEDSQPQPVIAESGRLVSPVTPVSAFDRQRRAIARAMDRADYASAIVLLAELELLADTSEQLQTSQGLLDEAVRLRVADLMQAQQLGQIDLLYEDLTLRMPEHGEFYLQLAELRIDMGNVQGALPVLAQIENHHQLGARARALIAEITAPVATPLAALPLTRLGDQFLIDVEVNRGLSATLLIDTGASMTILSPDLLQTLGYGLAGRTANFTTANGVVQAPLETLEQLALGSVSVSDVVVGGLGMGPSGGQVDGLLGMNVLREFDFRLDQRAAILYLDRWRGQ